MTLDFATLLLTEASTFLGLALLCLMLAGAERSLGLLRIMGFGNLAMALALPAFLLRGGEWHLLGIMLANGGTALAWGLQVTAVRRFAGRPASIWIGPAAALGWCLLCLWPAFQASFEARIHVASAISGGLTALMTWDLARGWTGWRPLRSLILLVCGLHPVILALRVAVLHLFGMPAFMALATGVVLSTVLCVAATTLVMIAEAMRRAGLEAQQAVASVHAEAAASRDLLAHVIEAMPCVIYLARMRPGVEGQRTFLSANTERVIGWPRAALDAPNALDLRTEQTAEEREVARRVLVESGEYVRELRMRRPDGSHIWVRRHSRIATRHPDGSFDVVGTISDITRERSLAAQVQASAKLATLGEMAANLAHEMGQPAATMCLAAGNAARGLRSRGEAAIPDALRRLDRVVAQGERMGLLMQHLKAFARAEPLAPGPVSVEQAVEGALVLTGAGLRQAEILLVRDIEPGLPQVLGQLVPLEQVLVNLLQNARDAILGQPPGHPRRILLRVARRGDREVAIEVADTGGGIDPAILPRLFEPFVTGKPMGEGLGLGLSVSHGLVRGMGGTITAASSAEGAIFTVILDCVPVSVAA